jgi:Protein prenyltransferase alpha subunit repeat
LKAEWAFVTNFNKRNISDYSGWSYRQRIILRFQKAGLMNDVWDDEWKWIHELLLNYPSHECLFQHYRFLLLQYQTMENTDLGDEMSFIKSLPTGFFPLKIAIKSTGLSPIELMKDKWVINALRELSYIPKLIRLKLGLAV